MFYVLNFLFVFNLNDQFWCYVDFKRKINAIVINRLITSFII